MSAACRSCGATIFWAVTPAGKRNPIDAAPAPAGNLVMRAQAGDDGVEVLDGPMLAISVSAAEKQGTLVADEPRWVSHFATCPQGPAHRKKR